MATKKTEITNAAAAESSQDHLDEKKENLQPDKMVGPGQLLVYRLRVLAAYLPAPELEVRRQLPSCSPKRGSSRHGAGRRGSGRQHRTTGLN